MKTAWYVVNRSWATWLNVLHWPYLLLHLSFVALGAALAPDIGIGITISVLIAFFLGMGVAAHAYDLLMGDPLQLSIPRRQLKIVGSIALAIACGLGLYWVVHLALWYFLALIALGVFFCVGYNLELPKMHGDVQFALFWGVFPFLVGYLANDPYPSAGAAPEIILGATFCYLVSAIQRVLSWRVRFIRRRIVNMGGVIWLAGKNPINVPFTKEWLVSVDEKALAMLCFLMPVLVATLFVWRS